MAINLIGKTALVTCSTFGAGYTAARMLAKAGAGVIVNGAARQLVYRAVACLQSEAEAGRVRGAIVNAWTEEGREALLRTWPNIDILVNNIGFYDLRGSSGVHGDLWENAFERTTQSAVSLARAYLPAMRAANWGRVIFMASEQARDISSDVVRRCFDLAVRELEQGTAGSGVRVNAIMPDLGLSREFMDCLLQAEAKPHLMSNEEKASAALRGSLGSFRRFVTQKELAEAVVSLAGDARRHAPHEQRR